MIYFRLMNHFVVAVLIPNDVNALLVSPTFENLHVTLEFFSFQQENVRWPDYIEHKKRSYPKKSPNQNCNLSYDPQELQMEQSYSCDSSLLCECYWCVCVASRQLPVYCTDCFPKCTSLTRSPSLNASWQTTTLGFPARHVRVWNNVYLKTVQ